MDRKFLTRRSEAALYETDPVTGRQNHPSPRPGTLSAKYVITPLFLALIILEMTDLVITVDSIPAVFAITPDPFLVFTSNIFALLGLRAL